MNRSRVYGMPSCEVVMCASGQCGIQFGIDPIAICSRCFKLDSCLKTQDTYALWDGAAWHTIYPHSTSFDNTPTVSLHKGNDMASSMLPTWSSMCASRLEASRVCRVSSQFQFQKAPRSVSEAWRCAESHNLRIISEHCTKKGGWTFPLHPWHTI